MGKKRERTRWEKMIRMRWETGDRATSRPHEQHTAIGRVGAVLTLVVSAIQTTTATAITTASSAAITTATATASAATATTTATVTTTTTTAITDAAAVKNNYVPAKHVNVGSNILR